MTTRRARLVRAARIGAVVACGLALALGAWTGWFSKAQPWEVATGWRDIPERDRPQPEPTPLLDATRQDPVVRWLGHSGFLVEWQGTRLLLDPNTSAWCRIARRLLEPVDVTRLGPVDAALISHAHYDHLDLPTLSRLRELHAIVLPAGSERYLDGPRFETIAKLPLLPGQAARIGALEVVAVPAAHHGSRYHPLPSRRLALGYVIRAGEHALYYAGDTGHDGPFAMVRERFHPELAILPIGAYQPAFPMRLYHLSPEDAVEAAQTLGVETVIPAHVGTFALALDRPAAALPRFAHSAREHGVRWVLPRLLELDGDAPLRAAEAAP